MSCASAALSVKWAEVESSLSKDSLAQILGIKWQGMGVLYTPPGVGNGYQSEGEEFGVCSPAAGGGGVIELSPQHYEVPSAAEWVFLLNELCCLQLLPDPPFSLVSPAAQLGLGPAQERRQDQTVVSSTGTREGKPCWGNS